MTVWVNWGEVHIVDIAKDRPDRSSGRSWQFNAFPASSEDVRTWLKDMNYRFLGFGFMPYHDLRVSGATFTWGEAMFPLWFPTLLSALLLWFLWRKTRGKPVGGAFPVEVGAKCG